MQIGEARLATNLLTTSPATMPLTPGFLSAVILPALTMSTTTEVTCPLERFSKQKEQLHAAEVREQWSQVVARHP